ncbi:MAG: hypothetical protein HZA28_00640 [Candidatus Omnitrophica bacterium]|nr:hypothetical protein [Candidatus Omnitrophota bacterium]
MPEIKEINVPGTFGHLLTNVRGAAAIFLDTLLGEELAGGQACLPCLP